MTEKIKLVQGDTRPALICTVTDTVTTDALDLTGCTVVLRFREVGNSELQATVPGFVSNATAGQVVFYPASAPVMLQGQPGDYEGEIEVTFPDGQVQTVFETLKFKVREEF